ncbi:MAG: hypothetical protein LBN43_03590 [Oscillospiraceae bacterium]|jgi:hypothetical protein|nr:hypothetical protein [Oscillospiraceae bacterium]
MSIYFIDYENVGAAGLQGINRLKEGDQVIIFHGMNSGSISFDLHLQIFSSAATVEYIRTGKSAKNYLDFQLATYLGYQISASNASEYIIVSRDAGFDSVIDFWNRRGGRLTFRRQGTVGIAPASTINVVKTGPVTTAELSASVAAPTPAPAHAAVVPVATVTPEVIAEPVVELTPVPAPEPVVEPTPEPEPVIDAPVIAPEPVAPTKPKRAPAKAKAPAKVEVAPVAETPKKTAKPRTKKAAAETPIAETPATVPVAAVATSAPAVAVETEGRKKLPGEYKKRIIENLKGYKLHVRGFSIIYALMMKYADVNEFKAALANAFQGKDGEIFELISDTYAVYRASLA